MLFPLSGELSKADHRDFESGISFSPNHVLVWKLLVTSGTHSVTAWDKKWSSVEYFVNIGIS